MSCTTHRLQGLASLGDTAVLETVFQNGKNGLPAAPSVRSVCGNIYRNSFSDQGKRYSNYSVDCADCNTEMYLEKVGIRKRAKTAAQELGWKCGADGKWRCPQCQK